MYLAQQGACWVDNIMSNGVFELVECEIREMKRLAE